MEGLVGVVYNSGIGPTDIELTFLDPPGHVIDVLEYAMLNHLTVTLPPGSMSGALSPISLRVLSMNITNETMDVDASTYGSLPTYLKKIVHRRVRVRARA